MNWNELALKTPPRGAVVDIWHKGKRKSDYVFFPALEVFRSKSTRFEINKSEVTHWMIIESPTESLNIAAMNSERIGLLEAELRKHKQFCEEVLCGYESTKIYQSTNELLENNGPVTGYVDIPPLFMSVELEVK